MQKISINSDSKEVKTFFMVRWYFDISMITYKTFNCFETTKCL